MPPICCMAESSCCCGPDVHPSNAGGCSSVVAASPCASANIKLIRKGCILSSATTYELVNLATDPAYGVLDPRIRVE